MSGLVAAEIRKLRTVRTTWVLTFVGWGLIVLAVSVLLFVDAVGGAFGGTDAEVAAAVGQVGGNSIIILIVGILLVTTEFRHGTMGRTLQLTPGRLEVLVSKLATAALYAIAFFVTGVVLVAVLLAVAAAQEGVSVDIGSRTLTALWHGPLGLALTALFGVAVGALLRSQVITITVTLVWLFIAENLVAGLVPEVARWLPFRALNAVFVSDEVLRSVPDARFAPLDPLVGLATFLAYVAVAVAGAAVLLRVRDV